MSKITCPHCKGKGYIWVCCAVIYDEPDYEKDFCPTCDGKGEVEDKKGDEDNE